MIEQSFTYAGRTGSRVVHVPLLAQNNLGAEETMVRWVRKGPGQYDYDFTVLDRYLDVAEKCMGKPKMVVFWVWDIYLANDELLRGKDHLVLEQAVAARDKLHDIHSVRGGRERREAATVSGPELKNPQVHKSNFLVEAYFRTEPGHAGGVLLEKMKDAGYSFTIAPSGGMAFTVKGEGRAGKVSGSAKVNDGRWHHVIAEADRASQTLTIYVDGRKDASGAGVGADVTLANDADLYVGGTPNGRCLAGDLDFLRIALGTLADAGTTIEELYAWEFDGPASRDFCGRRPKGPRHAGAIDLVPQDDRP